MNQHTLFCPQCDTFLHTAAACPHCHWQRPPAGSLGEAVGEALLLGRAVYGPPVVRGGKIWYAAPPTDKDIGGELLAVQQNGRFIQRFSLQELAPNSGIPVALGLADSGQHLLVGLSDYALDQGGAAKPLLALDPVSGEIVWQVNTHSRELSVPAISGGYACFAGIAQDAIYLLHVSNRLLTQVPIKTDSRFHPTVTNGVVIVISGSFIGPSTLLALDIHSSQTLWRKDVTGHCGQPVAANGMVYLPWGRTLYAFDAHSGTELWQYADLRRTSQGLTSAPLLVHGNWLLLPGGGSDPQQRDSYALHALDAASGQRQWVFSIPQSGPAHHIMVTPAVFDNSVIIGERQGTIYALNLHNGTLQWQASLPRRLAAPPVADGAVLLLPSRDGYLYSLRWQETAVRPPYSPQHYATQQAWELAAAAHLLVETPDYVAAARCLFNLGQWTRAEQLFRLAGDAHGEAEALARQGKYDAALACYPATELSPKQKAEWLSKAGQHGEAAELFASLAQTPAEWLLAAQAYERAQRPLKAMDAYKQANHQEEVERLAATLDLSLLDKARGLVGWRKLVERYASTGHLDAAADLLEQNEAWAEALALHQQAHHWERVRELSQQLGDWQSEAAACEQLAVQERTAGGPRNRQEWWAAAAQVYAEHTQWVHAERCFAAAQYYSPWAAALAAQGKLVEAAELLCRPESRDYAAAATYFWQAAETAVSRQAAWQQFNREAAALYAQAEQCYEYVGDVAGLRQARQGFDRCLNRPRPELRNAHIERPFQQGFITVVKIPLYNVGFAPATQVQLFAYGPPLDRPQREDAQPMGDPIAALPAGATRELTLHLEPLRASQDGESPLEFSFYLRYQDGEETRQTERFGLAAAVMPNYVDMAKELAVRGGPTSITLNMSQGNMFLNEGDAVVIERKRGEERPSSYIMTTQTTPPLQNLSTSRRCPDCQTIVDDGDKYCSICRHPL